MNGEPEIVRASDIAPDTVPTPTAPAAAAPSVPAPAAEPAASPTPPAAPAADAPRDSAGTPFDASKHLDKKHPTTGRWLPRSPGRGKSAAAGAPGANPAAASGTPPPPSFIPSKPPAPPPADAAQDKAKPTAEPPVDHSEDAAECAAQAMQFVAGVVFDSHDDCAAAPAEHKSMVRAFASYIRAKGWQATAGVATALVVVAYFLRVLRKEKPRATVNGWFRGKKPEPKNVTPEEKKPQPAPAAPAAPAQPVTPSTPAQILELVDPETHRF